MNILSILSFSLSDLNIYFTTSELFFIISFTKLSFVRPKTKFVNVFYYLIYSYLIQQNWILLLTFIKTSYDILILFFIWLAQLYLLVLFCIYWLKRANSGLVTDISQKWILSYYLQMCNQNIQASLFRYFSLIKSFTSCYLFLWFHLT